MEATLRKNLSGRLRAIRLPWLDIISIQLRWQPSKKSHHVYMIGIAVFRCGLKNGVVTTFAETVRRAASTVISMLSVVPTVECSRLTHASAIIFLSVGDHVHDTAF